MSKELKNRILSSIVLIPIVFFCVIKGSFLFNFLIFICFLITSYEWYKMTRKKPYYLPGIFFLVLSFYTVYQIRTNLLEFEYRYFIINTYNLSTPFNTSTASYAGDSERCILNEVADSVYDLEFSNDGKMLFVASRSSTDNDEEADNQSWFV